MISRCDFPPGRALRAVGQTTASGNAHGWRLMTREAKTSWLTAAAAVVFFALNFRVASGEGAELMTNRAQKLVVVGAWSVLLAIVVLTVVPPNLRPTTDAPHNVEHAAAFVIVGILFGLGYAGRAWILWAVAFCGIIEFMQLYVPGRHARWIDFAVDVVAAVVGILVGAFANRALKRLTL